MFKEQVINEMKQVFQDAAFGVDHTLKVLHYAEEIMEKENVEADQRELISIVTILHDIGALEAERKHGSMRSPYQEQEGIIIARQILERVGYDPVKTDRVCHIVGNHHTFSKIDGLDFQIQWEADLLVNLERMEIREDQERLKPFLEENFKTAGGKALAYQLFVK